MASEVKTIKGAPAAALAEANQYIADSGNAKRQGPYNYGPVEFAKKEDNATLSITINRKKVTTNQTLPTIYGTIVESEWTYLKGSAHPVIWFGEELWLFGVK